MKFAICNELFEGWELSKVFEYCAELGYHGVEIAPFTLAESVEQISPAQRDSVRRQAEQAGIAIAGLHWLLVKPEGMHLTTPDAEVRRRTADYLVALAHFCADIGGKVLVLGSPKQRSVMPGVSFEEAWRRAIDTLRPAVEVAQERGVTWCLEPLTPLETNFINTAEQAIRFAKEMDNPAMRIHLDVRAMSTEGKPIPQIIRESAGWFEHFHANDPNRRGPGTGEVDFAPIFAALREVGYNGYVSVEVFEFAEGPETIATHAIKYMRRVSAG